ncbi:hypothetical protein DPMN_071089 [Dreissena polymorpha]|uniref:Uncharacterized protein n=1 Tax=Dreissena polymorpha TaxID=45954 RepID=A0A9D3Z1X1_DREPO|nr:hypothetical protein DPMN_071089 [Dreissena polymorpha]
MVIEQLQLWARWLELQRDRAMAVLELEEEEAAQYQSCFCSFLAFVDVYSSDSKKVMRDKHDVLHVSFVLVTLARVWSNSNREVIVYGRVAVG